MDGWTAPSRRTGWPTAMVELEPAEHLLVWAFRRWVCASRDNTSHHICLVWNELARQLGAADAAVAWAWLQATDRTLREFARRSIHCHQPACPCLGGDEVWLVFLLAACQRGDLARAGRLAQWMVAADGVGDLLEAAGRLARVLRGHSLILPAREGTDGVDHAARAPTLH